MKKPVTFRFDDALLERARRSAAADNRSLTNFVETAVLRALDQRPATDAAAAGHDRRTDKENGV